MKLKLEITGSKRNEVTLVLVEGDPSLNNMLEGVQSIKLNKSACENDELVLTLKYNGMVVDAINIPDEHGITYSIKDNDEFDFSMETSAGKSVDGVLDYSIEASVDKPAVLKYNRIKINSLKTFKDKPKDLISFEFFKDNVDRIYSQLMNKCEIRGYEAAAISPWLDHTIIVHCTKENKKYSIDNRFSDKYNVKELISKIHDRYGIKVFNWEDIIRFENEDQEEADKIIQKRKMVISKFDSIKN